MKPLLAHVYEPHRVTYPCYVQPKLNGIRALYQQGCFQSRDELPFPKGLLDHLAQPLLGLFGPEVILDGELYVHGWPLQRINAAVTPVRQHPTEDTVKVEYWVFDTVDYTKPFIDRLTPVFEKLAGAVGINRVTTVRATSETWADRFYVEMVADGMEGIMYRLGDCPYTTPKQQTWSGKIPAVVGPGRAKAWSDQNNRCWHLLKRKDWQDDEFVCTNAFEGEGKLKGTLGSLECQVVPGKSVAFNVGSGLTDAERQHYWQNPPIGRLIKVKYLVLSSDGIPLNPTILAIL